MDEMISSRMETKRPTDADLICIFGRGGAAGIEWCGVTVPSVFLRALECKMYLISSLNTPIEILSQAELALETHIVPMVQAVLKRISGCVVAKPTPSDIEDVFLCSADPLHTIVGLISTCIRMQCLRDRMVSVAPVCAIITQHLDPTNQKVVLNSLSSMLKS